MRIFRGAMDFFQSHSKGLYKLPNDCMNHPEFFDHPTTENYSLILDFPKRPPEISKNTVKYVYWSLWLYKALATVISSPEEIAFIIASVFWGQGMAPVVPGKKIKLAGVLAPLGPGTKN